MLRLEGLSASYRGLKALQGIDVAVGKGEIVAVVGAWRRRKAQRM